MTTDCPDGSCPPASVVSEPATAPAPSTTKPAKKDDSHMLDPTTFVPPVPAQSSGIQITIEFCNRCRWLHRAVWVQTELFLTFPPAEEGGRTKGGIEGIELRPLVGEEEGGRFRVWLFKDGVDEKLIWDRKIEGGFPELKHLGFLVEQKQRIRDVIAPSTDLGHSDVKKDSSAAQ